MEADRTSPAEGCPGHRAGGRSPRHQRHLHVLKSGCRWCDCPPEYGPPTTIYNRFVRWAERGIWENLFLALAGKGRSAGMQMIDSTHIKAHRSAAGGKGGSKARRLAAQEEGATRRSTHSQMLKDACLPS